MHYQSILKMRTFSNGLLLTLLMLLTGCTGDDGATGPAGPPGQDAPDPIEVSEHPEQLIATINQVNINNGVTVEFSVIDEEGLPFVDLTGARFTLVKLIPSMNGDSSYWQSYVNRVESANGIGPGTTDTIQATTDSNGTLSNNGDGTYSYVFATDPTQVTSPIEVSYQPELTHRIALQGSGEDIPAVNATYTWRPSDGATEDIITRDIVDLANCNQCHDKLAFHGGGRVDTKYCVTCHNPGTTDAQSGHSVDFKVMIHKIHRGANLPSVVAGEEYAIWGYRDSKHDYSDVHFPQDVRNCNVCHDKDSETAADAFNWNNTPTIEACSSCHDDVDFSQGIAGGHPGGIMTDNSECTVCHATNRIAGSVEESHQLLANNKKDEYLVNLIQVLNATSGQQPILHFSVTNPHEDNQSYDIQNDPRFTGGRLNARIAWGDGDFSNEGANSGVASAPSVNALTNAVAFGDGTYEVTLPALPDSVTGSLAVALEGRVVEDFDEDGTFDDRVPLTAAVTYQGIDGEATQARRQIVSHEKCAACHNNLELHGGQRNGNTELCTMCHNPNNTDRNRRPVDPAETSDGKTEVAIDFKRLIHSIHAAGKRETPYYVWGFGPREHDFSHVRYPAPLNKCTMCHIEDSYQLPLATSVLATTVDSNSNSDPNDDLNITPTAAVCSSCHDGQLERAHMIQNGGASFSVLQADIDNWQTVETCQFCHGPGATHDVKLVHGLSEDSHEH